MAALQSPSCAHLAAWKSGSKERGNAYGAVARSMLALWKRDQDKVAVSKAHGAVCMLCATLSSSPSRHNCHSKEAAPGHNIALDLERVELYCSACRDYVYDGEFDRAMMGAATLAAEGHKGSVRRSGPLPHALEALNESAESDLRRRSSGDDSAALQDPAAIEKLTHAAGGSDGMPAGLRGLVNLGNTCFMNSVLQALLHAPVMRTFYLGGGHPHPLCSRSGSKPCLSCELDSIFSAAYSGQRSPFSPTSFLYSWWRHADSLAGYQQQDAHEFYIFVLSGLSTAKVAAAPTPTPSVTPPPAEVKPEIIAEVRAQRPDCWPPAQSQLPYQHQLPNGFLGMQAGEAMPNQGKDLHDSRPQWQGNGLGSSPPPPRPNSLQDRAPSPQPRILRPESESSGPGEEEEEGIVNRAFGGLLRSDVTCDACGYTSTVYEPFLDISLDIKEPLPLPQPILKPTPPATAAPHAPKQRKLSGAAAAAAAKAAARTVSAPTISAPAAPLTQQQPLSSAGPNLEVVSTPDLLHEGTPPSTETSDAAVDQPTSSTAVGDAGEAGGGGGSRAASLELSENLTEGGRSNLPEASALGASSTDGNSSVGASSAVATLMDSGFDETLSSPLQPPTVNPQAQRMAVAAGSMQQSISQQAAWQTITVPVSRSYLAASTSAPFVQRPLKSTAHPRGRMPVPYMRMPSGPLPQTASLISAPTPAGPAYGIRNPMPASLPASSASGMLPASSALLPQNSGRQAAMPSQHTAYGAHIRPMASGNAPRPLAPSAAPQGAPRTAPVAFQYAGQSGVPSISAPTAAYNTGQGAPPYSIGQGAPRPSALPSAHYAVPGSRPVAAAPAAASCGVPNAASVSPPAPNTVQNGVLGGRSAAPASVKYGQIAAHIPGQASVMQPAAQSAQFAAAPVWMSYPVSQPANQAAVTPPFARGARPARCGECHSCLNKHLKKGCLRNIELRKKAAEAQKQGSEPESMAWQPGGHPAQPLGSTAAVPGPSAWLAGQAIGAPTNGFVASVQQAGMGNGHAQPGRPPIYGNTAKSSQAKVARLDGGSAPGPSFAYREPQQGSTGGGGGTATLLGCLHRYVRCEALGKWSCDRCQRRQAVKQVSIRRLPAVLCLHLKRFQHPGIQGVGKKVTTPLSFPALLDMRPYLSSSVLRHRYAMRNGVRPADGANGGKGEGGKSMYELYAVVCHKGNLQGGHYICYIKCGSSWFECDDSWVMQVDEATARSAQAYMLYYRQLAN